MKKSKKNSKDGGSAFHKHDSDGTLDTYFGPYNTMTKDFSDEENTYEGHDVIREAQDSTKERQRSRKSEKSD